MSQIAADHSHLHARHRERGVNPLVYWLVRAVFQPFFHLYFRLSRIGREHVPESGPVIFAANHRSFLDPFIIATIARRPMYYVAKEELFRGKLVSWFLNSLGAFPVRRGQSDGDMLETAKAILDRGDAVLIFPEGTRIRPGALGRPRRGVGRLALETGAPVVPVAIIGTEAIRKKWRIRPHKVRVRVGRALTFPQVENASPQLAAAVTDRIWPNVMLQWEWLGGLPPLRRAAVVGAGSWGTAVAVMLARAGLEVDLGCRTSEQADSLIGLRRNERYLGGIELPESVSVLRASELDTSRHDLVVFAVPAAHLPAAVAAHGGSIAPRTGVLVCAKGLVPPLGTLPAAYVAERVHGWAVGAVGGPAHAEAALTAGASLVLAAPNAAFARQVSDALGRRRLRRGQHARHHRRRAGRLREERRRARRCSRLWRRPQRRRRRRRQGVRRDRRLRAPLRLPSRDVRRPGRHGRPRGHRARRRLAQPPRGGDARAGHGGGRHRPRPRADRRGRRQRAAARRPRA